MAGPGQSSRVGSANYTCNDRESRSSSGGEGKMPLRQTQGRPLRQPAGCRRYNGRHAESDSSIHSWTEISLPDHVSQDGSRRGHACLVWRSRQQALCDDAQRHGKDKTDSQPSAGARRALHDARKGDGSRICGNGAHLAAGGACAGATDHQPEVLDGADPVGMGENGYVFRDYV